MSRSELHDWECSIEKLGGKNSKELLEIAKDIYKTAFVRGQNSKEVDFESLIQEIKNIDSSNTESSIVDECVKIVEKYNY